MPEIFTRKYDLGFVRNPSPESSYSLKRRAQGQTHLKWRSLNLREARNVPTEREDHFLFFYQPDAPMGRVVYSSREAGWSIENRYLPRADNLGETWIGGLFNGLS